MSRAVEKSEVRQTVYVVDDDTSKASKKGVLAFQLHSGPSMRIELKELRLLHLRPAMKSEGDTTTEQTAHDSRNKTTRHLWKVL